MSNGSTPGHPGLSFGVGGMRRAFPPSSHLPNTNKQSPFPPAYSSQQPQQNPYSPQAYYQGTSSQVPSLQNGARPGPSPIPPTLPGPGQRAPPPRQMRHTYLSQSMSQQPLSQQPLGPPPISQSSLGPQSMSQQSLNQQQSLSQQPLSQPSLSGQQPPAVSQPPVHQHQLQLQPMQTSVGQPLGQHQSLGQPPQQQNENSLLSAQKSNPHPPPQPTLPPAQPQQLPHVQQVQQVQKVAQQPPPARLEPAEPVRDDDHHDEELETGSPEDELGDSSLEPKMIDGAPFVPPKPMGPMMSAPPEGGSFATLDAIHKHVLQYCTSVGYAIVIGRSKKTVPGLKKVLFVCDRAGKPPKRVSPEQRKRKTSSRKCDCQFGFFAIEQRTQWTVRYRPDPVHLTHNHEPSESPLLHPAARKLDSKMVAAVKSLKENGVGVTQTLEILQQDNPHVPLLPRDIYNARAAINRNPQKVATGLAEDRAAIYSKPQPSPEDRIRADLRAEIARVKSEMDKLEKDSQAKINQLEEKIKEKDLLIKKFEQFIDICNQRVMVRLSDNDTSQTPGSGP
ncbi:hypothetical protein QBC47DRAFT_389869 [Echria macrotheca]|uniref:Uncharacterized protein n=1 Tax=Echria macrotheca TaxID=438768 RepID=A0AAJ0F8G8_9PEZI|nr:hypothetical protein QBC47DRAFT_389869 [Echria macrotheca]